MARNGVLAAVLALAALVAAACVALAHAQELSKLTPLLQADTIDPTVNKIVVATTWDFTDPTKVRAPPTLGVAPVVLNASLCKLQVHAIQTLTNPQKAHLVGFLEVPIWLGAAGKQTPLACSWGGL